MKKTLFHITILLFICIPYLSSENIHFGNGQIFPGSQVEFGIRGGAPSHVRYIYKWNFGDGTLPVSGPQPSATHTYKEPGNYNVTCEKKPPSGAPIILSSQLVVTERRTVEPKGNNFMAGDPVLFESKFFVDNTLNWDFGDGTIQTGQKNKEHTYQNAGNYTVKVKDYSGNSSSVITCTVNITPDNRSVEFRPPSPIAGQVITFQARNFSSGNLKWEFKDGTTVNGGPSIEHTYTSRGNYNVKVTDLGVGSGSFIEQKINIAPDNRTIETESKYIFERGETKYSAKHFNSPSLKWDFGDGSVRNGGRQMIYKYIKAGNFTIKVYDFNGTSQIPVKLKVNVLRDNRKIVTAQKMLLENSEIEFEAKNFIDNRIKWHLDNGVEKRGQKRIKYKYSRAGMYKVYAIDFDGKGDKKIELNITVVKDKRNFQLGNNIIAGVPVSMKITNSQGGNFEWKFTGGKTASGKNPQALVFNTPGMKTISIIDKSGLYAPVTKKINVQPDNRSLDLGSETILKGESLKLFANRFIGGSVKWDFGDGTPPAVLSKSIMHKYISAGSFTITALDFSGAGKKLFKKTITVKEQMDDFNVNTLELVFSNGKYFRIIPMKSSSPGYMLKLKLRGRGILTGNWLFDGKVLGMFTKLLSGRSLIIMRGNDLPELPILEPGVHSLSFEFTNFEFEGRIPILRYFVTNNGAIGTVSPLTGAKLKTEGPLRLKWRKMKRGDRFEIAVSEVPFQFMSEKKIKWKKTGENNYLDLDTGSYTSGNWIYWQVRIIDATGTISSASEISHFKIL